MKLVHTLTARQLFVGQKYETRRGELVTLESWQEPKYGNEAGRVYCIDRAGRRAAWFPSVISAMFVEDGE